MERDLPNPNASICTRARQLSNLRVTSNPQDGIDPTHASILDRNVEGDVLDTPYVHMRV